jgi:hypothetical protein
MPYPTAQQVSAVYSLISPRGYRADFNDEALAGYVGALDGDEGVTGLDSPEVRSSMVDIVQGDGAIAGRFYHGPRPITLTGKIMAATVATRNERESLLYKVLNDCMLADGTLYWTPTGSSQQQIISVRKFQPARIRGGWVKDFFVSLVAPDPYIYSATVATFSGAHNTNHTITNHGNAPAPPTTLRAYGPGTNPRFTNSTTGEVLGFTGLTLSAGQYLDVNMKTKTAVLSTGASLYSYINYPTQATWWRLLPGDNTVRLDWTSGTPSSPYFTIEHRSTWV